MTRYKRLYYQAVSLHEAAHAFYWEKGGYKVAELCMRQIFYCQTGPRILTPQTYLHCVKGILAGPAISMMNGIPITYEWNKKDLNQAKKIISFFRRDMNKRELQTHIIRLTKQLNNQIKNHHFKKIERLADILLERRFLTGREVRKILKA
jgi:ribosomal protein L31E